MNVALLSDLPTNLPRITIYIEPDLKERLEVIAKRERRSLSQMAIYLIERAIIEIEQKENN